MANFIATTVCNEPAAVIPEKLAELREYLAGWAFDEGVVCEINTRGENHIIDMYGYGWMSAYKADDEEFHEDESDEFFTGLAKFISTPLQIMSVGAEKCRYASATRVDLEPNGKPVYTSL